MLPKIISKKGLEKWASIFLPPKLPPKPTLFSHIFLGTKWALPGHGMGTPPPMVLLLLQLSVLLILLPLLLPLLWLLSKLLML